MLQTRSICVARSADDRLQLWANAYDVGGAVGLLYTRWKGSGESAGWTPWQPFPGTEGAPGGGVATFYNWAAQLALPIKPGEAADGRMELWGLGVAPPPFIPHVTKSSTQPNAPWALPWADFGAPPIKQGVELKQITSVPLSDGRLQLFVVDSQNTIWSTVQIGVAWNALWSSWIPFVTAGGPAVGGLFNLTGARLLDGSVTLFALGADPNNSGNAIWAISRSASSSGSLSSPNAGWGTWAEFALQVGGPAPPPQLTNVKGIFAVTGSSFGYLWAYGNLGATPAQWYYTWTVQASSPPLWGNGWVPFPAPASEETDFRTMAAALLPEGGLQLFVLEVGKLGSNGYPAFTKIATAWQILGGSFPAEWTFNNGQPWEDFSLS